MKAHLRILLLTCFVVGTLTQDFDLSDALDDDVKPTVAKPAEKPKDPDGGLDLFDALGPDPPTVKPPVKPVNPGGGGGHFGDSDLDFNKNDGKRPGGGGGFSDSDLVDNFDPDGGRPGGRPGGDREYDSHGGADQPQAKAEPGKIAGIVSAVGVALLGAASSYIAYQKKKLCFKIQGGQDPEKGQRGTHSEPQVLSNLLQNN